MRLGVDLGGTKIEVLVLDAEGTQRHRRRIDAPRDDYDATIEAVAGLVEEAETGLGVRCSVGVGAPGSVIPDDGTMKNCNSTWINGRTLPADLERRLGRRVAVANDADCFTLSEAVDGAGAAGTSVFGVILGTGVGGGLAVGRHLLRGPNGIAGEWGHNHLDPLHGLDAGQRERVASWSSRHCFCGRHDCVETWLSGPGLAWTARELGVAVEPRDGIGVAGLAAAGDALASLALQIHAHQLAAALAVVVNVVDPDVVVLGGGVSNLEHLYNAVPRLWPEHVFSDRVRTHLRPARHGDASGVRGAAWLGGEDG